MWKPSQSTINQDSAQSGQDTWTCEFHAEYRALCLGQVDRVWAEAFARDIYPLGIHLDPRDVARVAYFTQAFEVPECCLD